jgi:hypothetical protein
MMRAGRYSLRGKRAKKRATTMKKGERMGLIAYIRARRANAPNPITIPSKAVLWSCCCMQVGMQEAQSYEII